MRALQMGVKHLVRLQDALTVTPVAKAQNGKLHAVLRRLLPIHIPLEHRQVDAPPGSEVAALIVGMSLQRNELPAPQRADGKVLVGRQPHHIDAIVDVDLPLVGIRLLSLRRRQQ